MKDGSDVITGCSVDGKTLLPVPSVCSENGPSGSLGLYKDCKADTFSPGATNTWGDFESFNAFTPGTDQLIYENGPLDENIHDGEGYPDPTDEESQWDAFNLGNENRQECERIFRLSFPAVPVEGESEDVKSLQALLTSATEENLSKLIKTRLCFLMNRRGFNPLMTSICLRYKRISSSYRLECDPSGQSIDGAKSGCEWLKSKGCRDLMTLLGTTADNSSVDGEKTEKAFTEIEQFHVDESVPPADNKHLIQTKLDVAPGSKSGHIFSYQLVLKKSQNELSLPFLAFTGKKSFFTASQLRFNF
ncbi:uncharacterized protein CLBA1-like isoform X1 [Dendrobates tinctorius]|uniref:uncharacterized protein CLBA1-like isoform X1 n=1 Tax=Dendrobates tinctorius TaxID=92724 RepID=UPI003CCA1698